MVQYTRVPCKPELSDETVDREIVCCVPDLEIKTMRQAVSILRQIDLVILLASVLTVAASAAPVVGAETAAESIALFSNETQVTKNTPPAFLAHAKDDKAVAPDNSRLFHEALKTHHVASEYLELPSGGHGLNGYRGPMWEAWQTEALRWLASQGVIPAASAKVKK